MYRNGNRVSIRPIPWRFAPSRPGPSDLLISICDSLDHTHWVPARPLPPPVTSSPHGALLPQVVRSSPSVSRSVPRHSHLPLHNSSATHNQLRHSFIASDQHIGTLPSFREVTAPLGRSLVFAKNGLHFTIYLISGETNEVWIFFIRKNI